MTRITLEDTDRFIKDLYELVDSADALKPLLKGAESWQERWVTLESFVISNMERVGLNISLYHHLWIKERFFYGMQERTGQDYGFCQHFVPNFRNRTKSILENDLAVDMDHKCTHGGEGMMTTCAGTDRDRCVILHPHYALFSDAAIAEKARQIAAVIRGDLLGGEYPE